MRSIPSQLLIIDKYSSKEIICMKKYSDELKRKIRESYLKHYAVSEVLRELKASGYTVNREGITNLLKREGIYEGLSGPNYIKAHKERTKKAMLEKHGVENYGQISRGFGEDNKIPYKKVSVLTEDFDVYKRQVKIYTARSLKNKIIPDFCEYTGIRFADADKKPNPNDPTKRTIDHKIPVIIGFLTGVAPEFIGAQDNLAYVIKHANSIKGNTKYEDFIIIAEKLREIYKNEGFVCNQTK